MNINANRIVIIFGIINFLGIAAINIPIPVANRVVQSIQIPFNEFTPKPVVASELKCLQENIFFEARNQSVLGQLMVGIVTLERKNAARFSDSICGVVFAKKQFSWANKGRKRPNLKNKIERDAWHLAENIAYNLYQADLDIPVFNTTYYHTTAVNPKWNRKLQVAWILEDHIFYKDDRI